MKKKLQISGTFFFAVCFITIIHSCKEKTSLPDIVTESVSGITQTTATVVSIVADDGGSEILNCGVCWGKYPDPSLNDHKSFSKSEEGKGNGEFTTVLTGLSSETTYYVRAYAVNSVGTNYGNDISFTTSAKQAEPTTLTTSEITDISTTSAVSGGTLAGDSSGDLVEWGICWNTSPEPSISNDIYTMNGDHPANNTFTGYMTGLSPSTKYYVRAFATFNYSDWDFSIIVETVYGNELSFTTSSSATGQNNDSIEDIEGNIYKTIKIGTQTWMAENLKTTRYNDNTPLKKVSDAIAWESAPGAYCWYNNDSSAYWNTYGALYNWNAVSTGKLCPAGWHVPTADDWRLLSTYLGGWEIAGGKLKEAGTSHWVSSSAGATNESGFTALPGGMRPVNWDYDASYEGIGKMGVWWSSTIDGGVVDNNLILTAISDFFSSYDHYVETSSGFSVRCVK
jgi:uncharacterized protein (TIGR02145 family)